MSDPITRAAEFIEWYAHSETQEIDEYGDVLQIAYDLRQQPRQIDGLREALDMLIKKYIANLEYPDHQFVACITPEGIPEHWRKPMIMLGYSVSPTEEQQP